MPTHEQWVRNLEHNRKKAREYARRYRERNGEKLNAYKREQFNTNPERYRELSRERNKRFRENHLEAERDRLRSVTLKGNHGITLAEYERMFVEQNGCCYICARPATMFKHNRLSIDHCHKTKRIRGLLCQPCNVTLGLVQEDTDVLRRMADYLERKD